MENKYFYKFMSQEALQQKFILVQTCFLKHIHIYISGMVLMSHIRKASKVTVNTSYFHPAHQHYTDEAHTGRNGTV
jgi:predicted glutamine amidotransferase